MECYDDVYECEICGCMVDFHGCKDDPDPEKMKSEIEGLEDQLRWRKWKIEPPKIGDEILVTWEMDHFLAFERHLVNNGDAFYADYWRASILPTHWRPIGDLPSEEVKDGLV